MEKLTVFPITVPCCINIQLVIVINLQHRTSVKYRWSLLLQTHSFHVYLVLPAQTLPPGLGYNRQAVNTRLTLPAYRCRVRHLLGMLSLAKGWDVSVAKVEGCALRGKAERRIACAMRRLVASCTVVIRSLGDARSAGLATEPLWFTGSSSPALSVYSSFIMKGILFKWAALVELH